MAKTIPPFSIHPFSTDNLADALSNEYTSIREKFHFNFFKEYLGHSDEGLNARTILIEYNYVSRSYLHDFASYYALCFQNYKRLCKRVHFFAESFNARAFKAAVANPNSRTGKKIWESYLGYVVIKPLPKTIIGATLLKTYSQTADKKRHYPVAKIYAVNIFGKSLKIESLVFQEQDSIVSACATTALWSAFHKTSELFQTPLPSPHEITSSAGNLFLDSGRSFPNGGLDHHQIGNAISSVNLVFELRNHNISLTHQKAEEKKKNIAFIKAFLYAYNKMGLPVLLGINLKDRGKHLITIVGFREENKTIRKTAEISLKAFQIERFYAHDDQVGPFSRLGFKNNNLESSWWISDDGDEKIEAEVMSIFVPLHRKIRINFEQIYFVAIGFDFLLYALLEGSFEMVWDIYLAASNTYKNELHQSSEAIQVKEKMLYKSLPKHIWIARAFVEEEYILELVFDTTGIGTGFNCLAINFYNDDLYAVVKNETTTQFENFKKLFLSIEKLNEQYFNFLLDELN